MTTLERVRVALRQLFKPSSDPSLAEWFGGRPVSSGVTVNEDQALTYTAVWACVQLIAGTLGSLPLFMYRRLKDGGKEKMVEHRLYRVLHDQPNPEMSSTTFRETLQAHVLLWGNGFAEITLDGAGRPAALWPIEPWRVSAYRDGNYNLRYRIANTSGSESTLRPEQVLHIPGLSADGVWGYSVIRKAREAIGLGLATERFGATFFGQGSTFGGVLSHPHRLGKEAKEHLTQSLKDRHQGVERAHNFIVLEEGIKYERLGIPPEDAQFLETRKFQRAEIASFFGVPPHMIGDVERSTSWGTGIEAQAIGFVTYNLRRWLVRWEQELTRKLISPLEMQQQAIEFLVDGLLRGDTATRYAAYNIGRNGGWFSANDIRELENMNPLPNTTGNVYLIPANMLPVDQVVNPPEPPPAPAAPAAEPAPAPAATNGAGRMQEIGQTVDAIAVELAALAARDGVAAVGAQVTELGQAVTSVQEGLAALEIVLPQRVTDLGTAMEGVQASLAAAEAERGLLRDRLAALLPSVLALIERAAHDFVRREGDRARRAAMSPEKLTAWMARFYPSQPDHGVKALGHAMRLYTGLLGHEERSTEEIRALVAGYVSESLEALTALLAEPPEDLAGAVDRLATRWEMERPAALCRTLLEEGLSHAAR